MATASGTESEAFGNELRHSISLLRSWHACPSKRIKSLSTSNENRSAVQVMKRTRRHQKGYVFKKGSTGYLRYFDNVVGPSGDVEHKQKCCKLADARTKQEARQ